MNIYSPYIYGSFTQSGSTSYFKENLGVGFIGGMHPSALFEVSGTTKGVLFPRMTEAQKNAIGSPATSLLIYQTDSASGYQYYNGTAWTSFGGSGGGVTGTTNYIPKFTGSTSLGDSQIYDSGTYVTIGGTSGLGKLNVWGSGSTLINVGDTTGGNYEGISSLNTGYLAAVNPSTNDYRYGPLEMNPAIMTMTFGGIDVMYGNITSGYVPTKATIGYADSSIFINYGTITKKVGINTTNTTEQLTVDGAISVGNSNTLVDELKSMNAGGSMIAYNGNTYTYTLGPGAGWLTYNPASLIMDFKPWWGGVLMTLDGSTNTTSINGELTVTGNTSLQNLTATTISATTYQNLPTDVRVTGGTYAAGTATFTNNTGGTFNVTGFSTGTTTLDNRLLLTDSSTGLITFGGLSATSGGTTFNVGAIKAWFVDNYTDPVNPVRQYVELSAQTGIAVTNISGHSVTYIAVDSGGTIYQQATVFNPSSQRSLISLGAIVHTNRIFVNTINNQPVVASAPLSQLSDLIEGIGFFNINGNVFSPNGANLNINKSSGDVFKQGANFMNDNKNPHTLFLSGLTAPSNIRYRLQTGVEYANTAVIDPNNYDLNGVLTPVTGSKYTIQRINVFQSNLVRIQYGQQTYANLADAIQGISTEAFIVEDNILDNGLFRALLLIKANTTDLTNTADALFIEAGKFGSTAGLGSLSTTTLQQAYNNSTAPEILINSTLGGLSIQNGTGNANNVTNLLEGINSTGSITSLVRADGYISGTTFQTNGFNANSSGLSATTYLNLPTDIRVTGGTYSTGTATFTNNTGGTFNVTGFNTNAGTVTSVAALTLGTTGTDLNSTVANGTTTPVITLNVPNASTTARGVVTTGAQTFGGIKTFNDEVVIENSIIESQSGTSVGVGSTVVYSRTVTSETAFFFDYVLTSGANARAGSLMVVINGSNIEFNETSTNDIGNTAPVTLKPSIGGGVLRITATSTSGTWAFKSVTRII